MPQKTFHTEKDMQATRSKTLEVTVLTAENLTVDRKPVTKNAYVVVRTESLNCCTTGMAAEDGSHSLWNEKFFLEIPMHARSITFEVYYKNSVGAKVIGVVRIALSDFLGGGVSESYLQFLSYRLRDSGGRRNGVINFSVRVKMPECSSLMPKPAVGVPENKNGPCGYQMRTALAENNSNEVVVGIPVWWNYTKN